MKIKRPEYEALDGQGYPHVREARYINELPTPEKRKQAMIDAMPAVSKLLGLVPISKISYGLPVHEAFKLTRTEIQNHQHAALLKTHGSEVSLDFVPQYQPASA